MVNTTFKASFRSRDDSRYESILKIDSQAMAYVPTLETADFISSMTRQDVRNWLDTMISLELKYIHLNTTATPRFVEVMSAFLKKCSHYDLLSHQEWNRMDNEERERAWAIRQGISTQDSIIKHLDSLDPFFLDLHTSTTKMACMYASRRTAQSYRSLNWSTASNVIALLRVWISNSMLVLFMHLLITSVLVINAICGYTTILSRRSKKSVSMQ